MRGSIVWRLSWSPGLIPGFDPYKRIYQIGSWWRSEKIFINHYRVYILMRLLFTASASPFVKELYSVQVAGRSLLSYRGWTYPSTGASVMVLLSQHGDPNQLCQWLAHDPILIRGSLPGSLAKSSSSQKTTYPGPFHSWLISKSKMFGTEVAILWL